MPKDPLFKQAKREVRNAKRPQRQAIRRAARAGEQDFNEAQQRVAQVTKAMLGQLSQIPGAYAGQTSGIIGDVTSGIGALGEQLGQNSIGQVPLAEQQAGIANVHAIGAGAIEQIAGQQQNMADYLASGAQQGAVQGAVTSRNYLKDYSQFQKDIRQQRIDLQAGTKDEILQRLDQLKQERFDRSMALKQLGMQQQQIDQANASLAAEQWYREQQLKRMREADKRRDREARRDRREEEATEEEGPEDYGISNEAWWPPGETAYGGNAGALGQGTPPSTTLPPGVPVQAVVQWLQTQPLQTQAGRQAATNQMIQWLQAQGATATVTPSGTIEVVLGPLNPDNPAVLDIVQHFNAMIGGA